jgi:predicted GNAT family acetyltransferase
LTVQPRLYALCLATGEAYRERGLASSLVTSLTVV